MIDRLVAAGYVERRPDPVDRRQTWVSRRPGSALDEVLPAICGPLGEDMRKITDGYSAHELEAIGDFLSRTREVLVTRTARFTAKPAPPERGRSRRAPKAPRDA
jgi:DNA-binding MarR family transcriptional regulator